MARKSRKTTPAVEPVVEAAPLQIFPTAIYARLSVENSGKSENVDVIANQIEICKSYIADRPYLSLVDTYIDNGHTGTVFDRPEFNRLMTDIKSGRIKCLVVRDLSRFGRDYIETGTYLERIFPQIGLRFIAIKENYDNFDTDGSNESLMIPLQNMINALYSKDISRKVSTALKAQMEQGTFQKRNLPYGYRWNEEHTNMVIDEETASYVRLIFQRKIEGWSMPMILDELDRLGAPNTELRKRQNGTRTGDGCSCKGWHKSTVYGILTNPHYVGDTVLGRSMVAIYKGIKSHNVKDKDEWIVFPNTHEAIISREDFQKVQDIMNAASEARQTKMQKSEEIRATLINLFDGKIICADCGKRMYFHRKRVDKRKDGGWYAFYECSTYVGRRYEHCTAHYIRQDRLERDVLAAILLQVKAALDYDKLLDKLRGSEGEKNIRDKQNALITSLNLKLSGVSKKRTRLYEDFAEGILDEEEYTFAKKSYDEQFADLSRRLDEAVQRRSKFNEAMSVDNKWITLMKSVSTATQLSQELVDESVEMVKIHEDGAVELVMKYGDIYALTIQSIKEVQEAM
ncbi:recombinase family protein [Merdimmobilis hominis]|uniref:recombinase family protein n=1 Tax=Merdimmobilis hominis TaxID=2897707 RepID=UPI00189A89BF|nr:recombinase family protein [Merdimmobilis hominis]